MGFDVKERPENDGYCNQNAETAPKRFRNTAGDRHYVGKCLEYISSVSSVYNVI